MSDSSIKTYPSTAIQQYQTKIAFLIDCDGGLSAIFDPKRPTIITPDLIKDFPPNSDIFLFFNSRNPQVVERMQKLEVDNPNVYTFPNIIKNARNGSDMNLTFTLGAINNKYDNYFIIVGRDRAYEEVKERLVQTHPRLKNHAEVRRFNSPKELGHYVREMNKIQNDNQSKPSEASSSSSPTSVKFTSENIFRQCPLESWEQSSRLYRFNELLFHLDNEHPEVRYQYCSTCEEMIRQNDHYKYRQFQEHLQKEHLENDAGYCLTIQSP